MCRLVRSATDGSARGGASPDSPRRFGRGVPRATPRDRVDAAHNPRILFIRPAVGAGIRMIYKFKSRAAGDVIMMGPAGDDVLRLLGKAPGAKGIIEVAAMPAAVAAIEAAVAADESARASAEKEAAAAGTRLAPREGVGLRQRAWPLVEMMKRSAAAGADIVWGV